MQMFKLGYYTAFHFDGMISEPVQMAISHVTRDIRRILIQTDRIAAHDIYLKPTPSLAPEAYEMIIDDGIITVRAADDLGFIYALYYISQQFLGVQPLWFWNDQVFEPHECITIPPGFYSQNPARIRYRGWCLCNHQLLDGWAEVDQDEECILSRIYETVLRLGGNMMVPASLHDPLRAEALLVRHGLYLAQPSDAPLGADPFRLQAGNLPVSYDDGRELYDELWQEAVIRQKDYPVIWTVGFPGSLGKIPQENHPAPEALHQRGEMISRAIGRQMELVRTHIKNPVFCMILQGDMLTLRRQGHLPLPDDVIQVFSDNDCGRMRTQSVDDAPQRIDTMLGNGKNGVYCHTSYRDPLSSNSLTMSPVNTDALAAELEACLENSANKMMIVNCSSIKPHVYIIDLLAKLWRDGRANTQIHALNYAGAYYGRHAVKIAQLLTGFPSLAPQYSKQHDTRAGEALYYQASRRLIQQFLAGDTHQPVTALRELGGDVSLAEQAVRIQAFCESNIPQSDQYIGECDELRELLDKHERQLFDDTLWLQATIHNAGLHGLHQICLAIGHQTCGESAKAFVHAYEAYAQFCRGLEALQTASHDHWHGFYHNDCLTNISTAVYASRGLRMFLRIINEGDCFMALEREYLTDAPHRNYDCSNITAREKSDAELARELRNVYDRLQPKH